jgi:hypothetical protein
MKHLSDTLRLLFPNIRRILSLMRPHLTLIMLTGWCAAQQPVGRWTLNIARSTFGGNRQAQGGDLTDEPHQRGEVVTFERIDLDGRAVTNSTLLYLAGTSRRSDGPVSG